MEQQTTYNANSIAVLEGLEAVRKRPGMYIGSVSTRGLNHLIYEIVDNAVDEHLAGYCSNIQVILDEDGTATIQDLSGFGCRILANGHHPNPEVQRLAEQVDLETLLEQSDIVVLHCPMSEQNYHMINAGTIQKMKPGALLVNTARGGLVDTQAVYEALQNRRLGGFAMDVYEYENLTARKDYRGKPLDDSLLSGLLAMDQVLFTTHTAFYTDQAIENIVESSLENLASFFRAGESENEI